MILSYPLDEEPLLETHQKRHLKLLTLELNDHFFSVLPPLELVSLGRFQWYIQGFHHGVLQENNPLTSVISLARWLFEDVGMCNSNSNPSMKLPRIHVSFPEENFFFSEGIDVFLLPHHKIL